MLKSTRSWQTVLRIAACTSASLLGVACGSKVPVVIDEESPYAAAATRPPAACATDLAPATRDWGTLRKHYPYHLQGVALSEPSSGGCRALVVAEPPPFVTEAGLRAVDPAHIVTITTMQHGIGVDGWTKDAVVVLPPMEEREVAALVSSLHRYLFKTAYKAQAISIEATPPHPSRPPALDLRITAAELNGWLTEKSERFVPVEGGKPRSLDEVTRDDAAGVYFTRSQGLVVWSIPRKNDIGEYAVEGRQFALDADVVLGAFATPDALLVVGREREIPTDVLPPLRFETIALLAGAKKKELAQSYERNTVFAGRLPSGSDWAPILLSPELIDTEFGSLLDITDQLLKGWSQNGETTYINFDYPKPDHWAFAKPVSEEMGGNETVFNWNTSGLGGAVKLDKRELFWVRGTGALTVTYKASGRAAAAVVPFEDKAYEFFAQLRDPHLARVIQYTALYQIFRCFDIKHAVSAATDAEAPAMVMEEETLAALNKLAEASPAQLDDAAKQLAGRMLSGVPEDRRFTDLPLLTASNRAYLTQVRKKLDAIPKSERRSFFTKMASALADPRTTVTRLKAAQDLLTLGGRKQMSDIIKEPQDAKTRAQIEDFVASVMALELDPKHRALQAFADIDQIKDRFVRASLQRSSGWIRTPAIVISTNSARRSEAIGGHSLDSAVTKFTLSPEGMLGKHLADGSIGISEGSLGQLRLGRGPEKLAQAAQPARASTVALELAEAPSARPARGFRPEPTARVPGGAAGWQAKAPGTPAAVPLEPGVIRIERTADGPYRVRIERTGEEFDAWTKPDVADVVARESKQRPRGEGTLRIEMPGFTDDEARGLIRSAELHASEEVFGVIHEGESAAFTKALQSEYDLAEATLHETQYKAYPNGTSEVGFAVEIPAKQSGKPSLWMRIKLFFETTVSLEVRDNLSAAVQRILERFKIKAAKGQAFGFELRNELRKVLKQVGNGDLKIHLESESGDITIVEREHRSNSARG